MIHFCVFIMPISLCGYTYNMLYKVKVIFTFHNDFLLMILSILLLGCSPQAHCVELYATAQKKKKTFLVPVPSCGLQTRGRNPGCAPSLRSVSYTPMVFTAVYNNLDVS